MNFNILGNNFRNFFSRWQFMRDPQAVVRRAGFSIMGTNTPTIEINCDNAIEAFDNCPPLSAIIGRKMEMFSNGEWKCVNANDEEEEIVDDEGLKLLNNPHPLITREDFLKQYIFYKDLFANVFIRQLRGSILSLPKTLIFLPSEKMSIELTNKFLDQHELEGIIKNFLYENGGEKIKYDIKEILYKADNFSFTEGKGVSKLSRMKWIVNNTVAAYTMRNINIVSGGIKGFISPDGAKEGTGMTMPFMGNQKAEVEKEFEKQTDLYSPTPKIKVSPIPLKWEQMGSNTKELMLFEEVEDNFIAMCAEFGMAKELFIKDATFENRKEAEKSTYQNAIQPDADSFAGFMSHALGAHMKGRKYLLDYSWMPLMQTDKQKEEATDKVKAEKLAILLSNGVISREAFAEMMGIEMSGEQLIAQT